MRLLFVYCMFPEPDTNAGGFRLFEIIKIYINQGYSITFLAKYTNNPRYRSALEDLGVECICDSGTSLTDSLAEFANFLRERAFDVTVFSHYFNYNTYAPYLQAFLPKCRLILDTVDLHFLRFQREAALSADPMMQKYAEQVHYQEVRAILDADCLWMVTKKERDIVLPIVSNSETAIHVVPTIHPVEKHLQAYSQRNGVVFLGNYGHSPNVDAVNYFMQEVFPLLCQMLPEVHITIAGNQPPSHFQEYAQAYENVSVTGFVPDHRKLLSSHLVGIAPLRYGAGMKGKIGEYLACGLPCVSTSIGSEGMELEDEHEILLADDPIQFAKMIMKLYCDIDIWQALSSAGARYIQKNFSLEAITPFVLNAIPVSKLPERQGRLEQQLSLIKLDRERARAELEQLQTTVNFLELSIKRVRNHPIYKMFHWLKYMGRDYKV